MPTGQVEELLAAVEKAVERGLEYFEGPGAASGVRVGEWGIREVLSHMVFWHRGTVEGMESVSRGGGPTTLQGKTDELNAETVGGMAGRSVGDLIEEIRGLQTRLATAVRALPDPGVTVLVRNEDGESSAIRRLQAIAHHWREHIDELEAARAG